MLIFFVIIAFYSIVFLCELFFCLSKKTKLALIFPLLVFLPLISGFNVTSPDYLNYREIFKEIGTLSDLLIGSGTMSREPLFSAIVALANSLFDNDEFIFCIIAFISVGISLYVFLNCSPYVGLSVCLYLIHPFLNKEMIQIRAGLATAFILVFVYFLSSRNKASLVAFFMGVSVHFSSLVSVVPYLIYKFTNRNSVVRFVNIMLATAFIFYLLGIKDFLLKSLFDLGLLPEKVGIYLIWDKYNYTLGLMNPIIIKLAVLHLLLVYTLKNRLLYNELALIGFVFNGFSLSWLLIFNDFAILAARIASITSVTELILIPLIISSLKIKQKFVVWMIVTVYLFSVLIFNVYIRQILPSLNYRLF